MALPTLAALLGKVLELPDGRLHLHPLLEIASWLSWGFVWYFIFGFQFSKWGSFYFICCLFVCLLPKPSDSSCFGVLPLLPGPVTEQSRFRR